MIDGIEMNCFDLELFDPATGRKLGWATDCVDLASITGGPPPAAFAISNTTFFVLPGGTLTSRNRTTISPVVEGSPDMTHITGDLPIVPNILGGTGRFQNAQGIVRLSGVVDISQFFITNRILSAVA